ncbi:sulfatase-like hydrolase/transferase [Roseibacillus persicicus]|uniref:sulfatase-like hydrolase/transferase n=1 Tax=Roseibacillus persicicus TaxID=454148 RepID=UPI0028101806|nr:sulfatase-like hydrolase/transferase [Roseibacillus persicicus]MDQ8190669.1 sulfatase-like hydrolase/transferase [Roseibacillus persicicus]
MKRTPSAYLAPLLLLLLSPLSLAKDPPAEAPPGVEIQRDLSFLSPDREEKLDLYQPENHTADERLPAVVIIHGGGWTSGDKNRMREYVTGTSLAKAGYLAISINYETRAGKCWPNNLHDCKNAVRWLRKNADTLGVDSDRIGVIGGSAGGHLALMVAYTGDHPKLSPTTPYPGISDKVSACVDMYGITNLLTRQYTEKDGTPNGKLKGHRLFKEEREEAPAKWRNASPVNYINAQTPPTLIFHGTEDATVDRDQSKELHALLQKAGVDSTLRMIEGADHAWPLQTKDFDLRGEMVAFFDKHLKKASVEKATSLRPANNSKKPNILFISVDDLNDWEGALNGHPQALTPHMDRLFQQGTLFTNAHCSQAVCTASRNSLLSGLHPSNSGWYSSTTSMRKSYEKVMGNHKMLPQHFRDNGYHTMAVGKVFHQGTSDYKERTKDFWDETGPKYKVPKELLERGDGYGGKHFYPFPKQGSQISRHYGKKYEDGNSLACGPLDRDDMPEGKMFDEIIAEWAVEQLEKEQSEPFFLAVGFVRPHAPFTAPREFFKPYENLEIKVPHIPADEMSDIPLMGKSIAHGRLPGGDHQAVINLSDTYWKEMVTSYLSCVSFVDAQIGKVIEALEASPHRENTIIVLWSDHGQHLGEKKHWRKQSLWEESTRVPLFFKAPGTTSPATKSPQVVSLLDIYPTLVELCDLPQAPKLDGKSLLPLLKDPSATRETPVLQSWYYGNYAVRSNDWRYIQYRDGSEELYDHRKDPGEHHNLAQDSRYANIIAEHQKWIPKNGALPAGSDSWKGDKLDRRIEEWKENDSLPDWLK